ncbi:hypothetical protein ACU6U9_23555 [Pseudomonas sp. HK3]|jgi:hypothetical protein
MYNSQSGLMHIIKSKVLELGDTVAQVTISIRPIAEIHQTQEGDEYWVKWFYWQVYGEHCAILYESDLLVAHGELSETLIQSDLKTTFDTLKTSVNNEIYFDD